MCLYLQKKTIISSWNRLNDNIVYVNWYS
jgi:hypothetical protein